MFARVLVCIAAAAVLQAQGAAPAGLILGQVVDATSGQPIPEAEVTIRSTATVSPTSQVPSTNTRVIADGNGRFFFAPLPAGGYTVRASKPGYLDGTLGARRPPSPTNRAPGVRPLDLDNGQRVTDATIRIWKQASIEGLVFDDSGDLAVGIEVVVMSRTFVSGRPRFVRAGSGLTDDRGTYRVTGLASGNYVVLVPAAQTTVPAVSLSLWQAAGAVASPIGEELSTATRSFSALGSPGAQPIGAHVLMTMLTRPLPPPTTASGLPLALRPTYYPSVTSLPDAQVITLAAGEERRTVNVQLRAEPAVRVAGVVAGPDGPVKLAALRLVPAAYGDAFPDADNETATGLTDEQGAFTLFGVTPGQYLLKLVSPRPGGLAAKDVPLAWASQSVSVGETDLTGVTVNARAGIRVTGRIEIAAGSASRAPATLGVMEDVLFNSAGEATAPFRVTTGKDRTFTIVLPARRYTLTFSEPPGWWITAAIVNGRDVRDGGFDLSEDTTVVLHYSDAPTQVAGTIRTAQGAPDPTATALIFPADRRLWSGYSPAPARMGSNRAAASGAYAIANLPPGDYLAAAVADEDTNDWTNPAMLERLTQVATPLTVRDGETRTLDLRTVRIR